METCGVLTTGKPKLPGKNKADFSAYLHQLFYIILANKISKKTVIQLTNVHKKLIFCAAKVGFLSVAISGC